MPRLWSYLLTAFTLLLPLFSKAQENEVFITTAPERSTDSQLRVKSNLLPWVATIPNLGGEVTIGSKWSVTFEMMYCPWKLSDKFSVKTVALLPEGRWWLKSNDRGSFFDIHLNLAWYNVRANSYRYQDSQRPLLGAGIGYGYRLPIARHWAFEFEIGAGMANTRYDRYYNVANGALKDTRVSTYWGIDRLGISVSYYICDL